VAVVDGAVEAVLEALVHAVGSTAAGRSGAARRRIASAAGRGARARARSVGGVLLRVRALSDRHAAAARLRVARRIRRVVAARNEEARAEDQGRSRGSTGT